MLEGSNRLRQCPNRIVVQAHPIGVGGQNRIGDCLRASLVESIAGKPERIVSIELVKPLGVTPLVIVDALQPWTVELFLDQSFNFGRRNALNRCEFFGRPSLRVLVLGGAGGRISAGAADEDGRHQQQSYERRS